MTCGCNKEPPVFIEIPKKVVENKVKKKKSNLKKLSEDEKKKNKEHCMKQKYDKKKMSCYRMAILQGKSYKQAEAIVKKKY